MRDVITSVSSQLRGYVVWTRHAKCTRRVHTLRHTFKPGAAYTVRLFVAHVVLISSKSCKGLLNE
jgi:hypothetical protein